MAKKDNKIIIILIVVAILFMMGGRLNIFTGSLFNPDCTFGTNVVDGNYEDGTWVVVNGIPYGFKSTFIAGVQPAGTKYSALTLDGKDVIITSNNEWAYVKESPHTMEFHRYYIGEPEASQADLDCGGSTCTDTVWTPSTSTVCDTETFTQTLCGENKIVAGTKDCSTTTCTTHDSYKCYNDDVYWYDSCNNRESIKQTCTSGFICSDGNCGTAGSECPTCPNCDDCCPTCQTYTCSSLGCPTDSTCPAVETCASLGCSTGTSASIEADTDGDGKISLMEWSKITGLWINNEESK